MIEDTATLDTLEGIVDKHGLAATLAALEAICYGKADHIRTNWQDGHTAKPWDRTGRQLGNIAGNAERLGLTNG